MYIENKGQIGDSKKYTIQLDDGLRLDALVSKESAVIKENGQVLDSSDLIQLVAEELKETVLRTKDRRLTDRANEILGSLGYDPVQVVEEKVPLDSADQAYVRVRHYIGPAKAEDIAQRGQFGGEGHTLDQGKVFLEPASWKILSPQEFQDRYAITHGNHGTAFIEFLVPRSELESQINDRNGKEEYFVRANSVENDQATYKIASEVKIFRR